MELKEMADTGVVINNVDDLKEYLQICEDGGWNATIPKKCSVSYSYPSHLEAKDGYKWDDSCRTKITLAQFKERNGIMKWKQDDVLVNGDGTERLILGVCGRAYIATCADDFKRAYGVFTEHELEDYTLKTDEPEMVELTLEDVAKLHGSPVDLIRIKEKE